MSSFWKIFLIAVSVIVVVIIGSVIWFYQSFFSIEGLDVSYTDTPEEKIEKVDNWFKELQGLKKFNGAVLLIKNDTVLFKGAYGYEDCSKTTPLTTKSMFRLASVSKQFTAAAIMVLHDKGQLNFDDPYVKYIPEFPYKDVRIRHLLNQTSGIPDAYMGFPDSYPDEVGEVLTIQKMLQLLIKASPEPLAEPNESYEYSNSNYVLLAALIEKISGLSFEEFMKTQLFEPLGMSSSRVWNLESEADGFEHKAQDFDNYASPCKNLKPGILDGVAGDGAVFSSVEDFVIWNQFWYANSLMSDETLQEAFKAPLLNDGSNSDYGFGWLVSEDTSSHEGLWLGAHTYILRNTKEKNCIVLLDNSSNFDEITKIEFQLAKVF